MAYTSPSFMFRNLTDAEEEEYREYARTHDFDPKRWEVYHPVCRAEWVRLEKVPNGKEA